MIEFRVNGKPEPKGSVVPFICRRTRRARVKFQNAKQLKKWQDSVALTAKMELTRHGYKALDCAVALELTFYLKRPRSHYRTGRHSGLLKPSSPKLSTTKPDLDKLQRAVLDALEGVLYVNDSRVCGVTARKLYGKPGVLVWASRVEVD